MGKYIDRDGDEWTKGCSYCSAFNRGTPDKCEGFHESIKDNGEFKKHWLDSMNANCDCSRFSPKT